MANFDRQVSAAPYALQILFSSLSATSRGKFWCLVRDWCLFRDLARSLGQAPAICVDVRSLPPHERSAGQMLALPPLRRHGVRRHGGAVHAAERAAGHRPAGPRCVQAFSGNRAPTINRTPCPRPPCWRWACYCGWRAPGSGADGALLWCALICTCRPTSAVVPCCTDALSGTRQSAGRSLNADDAETGCLLSGRRVEGLFPTPMHRTQLCVVAVRGPVADQARRGSRAFDGLSIYT